MPVSFPSCLFFVICHLFLFSIDKNLPFSVHTYGPSRMKMQRSLLFILIRSPNLFSKIPAQTVNGLPPCAVWNLILSSQDVY